MASVYYGYNRGEGTNSVERGTSTLSDNVELVINDAVSLTKAEVLQALEYIKEAILSRNSDPF